MTKWINIYRTESGYLISGGIMNSKNDAEVCAVKSSDFLHTVSFEVPDAPAVPVGEE